MGMAKPATIIIKTAYPLSSSTVNPDEIKTGSYKTPLLYVTIQLGIDTLIISAMQNMPIHRAGILTHDIRTGKSPD
jgi:hypothetical protein